MTLQEAYEITENWNGEDSKFLYEGAIYTEEDVWEAVDLIEKNK